MGIVSELFRLFVMTCCMLGYIEYTVEPKDPVSFIKNKWNKINPFNVLGDDFECDISGNTQPTRSSSDIFEPRSSWASGSKAPWAHINMAIFKPDIPQLEQYYTEHAFDLNARLGQCEQTLLHGALKNSKYKAAIWLLEKGASVSVKNKNGESCWDIFIQNYLGGLRQKKRKTCGQLCKQTSQNFSSTDPFDYYFASALVQVKKEKLTRLMISRGKDPKA